MFLCWLAWALPLAQSPPIEIRLAMDDPHHHFYQVEMVFPSNGKKGRTLQMATWILGSYKIRDFSKSLEGMVATDPDKNPVPFRKVDKTTWYFDVPEGRDLHLSYRLFAYEMTVRTNYLDDRGGFLNPVSAFFYDPQARDVSYHIQVALPSKDWRIMAPLPRRGANFYIAANWEVLADSPFQFGQLKIHSFNVQGVPHYWAFNGDPNIDVPAATVALQNISETVAGMFGDMPFNDYYYLTHFTQGARGGLEHGNNTLTMYAGSKLRDKESLHLFYSLMIHEYFHAWNAKAIRDKVYLKPDFSREVYSTLLWVTEGWTSYYDQLLMLRSGIWDEKDLLKAWSKDIDRYLKSPGEEVEPLSHASFDAWIHYYQRTETSFNSHSNYYNSGSLTALCLDLLIRNKTKGKAGLDDVLRQLYKDFGAPNKGIDEAAVVDALAVYLEDGARTFVEQYIHRAQRLPLEGSLQFAGLSLSFKSEKDGKGDEDAKEEPLLGDPNPHPAVWLGALTRSKDGHLTVFRVPKGSPAWQAGLDFDDEILAIADRRVHAGNLDEILGYHLPGDRVAVLVARQGRLKTLELVLEAKPEKAKLVTIENPSDLQKRIYEGLFQAPQAQE